MSRPAVRPPAVAPARASAFDREFARDVLLGLSKTPKSLPCRYFYDRRGSALFEKITELHEYYPTRTEIAILRAHAGEIERRTSRGTALVELGSGSSRKTEILLESIDALNAYVAIDVSEAALSAALARLSRRFLRLRFHAIVADFSRHVTLPSQLEHDPKLGFFPGSTIGNLAPNGAVELLVRFRNLLAPDGRLVIGVDLKKDASRLVRAYDDRKGVTAAFNLNILARINRELDGDFELAHFRHRALYDAHRGRIEMHLVSTREQSAAVLGHVFRFVRGESIHTENSYKYTIAEFQGLARAAGWPSLDAWTDEAGLFSVHQLAAANL